MTTDLPCLRDDLVAEVLAVFSAHGWPHRTAAESELVRDIVTLVERVALRAPIHNDDDDARRQRAAARDRSLRRSRDYRFESGRWMDPAAAGVDYTFVVRRTRSLGGEVVP